MELIQLCGDKRHYVLIIRAIGSMGVNEHIRIPLSEHHRKTPGIPGIRLDEIPVQIKVLRISSKTIRLGSILIGPRTTAAIQSAANIVHWNNTHDYIPQLRTEVFTI